MKSSQPICYPSSFHLTFHLLSIVILLITYANSASNRGNETDHLALLSFKSMITHDPYGALASWNTSSHFCDWNGVLCGKRHKRVIRLRLYSQGLSGYLSPQVGNLRFLRYLVIFNNSFQGTIPPELGRLSRLSLLNLDSNKFEGVIPTNLSGSYNLDTLVVSANRLVGSIPKEIGFLSKLAFIVIHGNNLTGGIPPFLGNLTSIESFSATRNPLGGSIPDTLGRWKRLKDFYCGVCNLNGTIPDSIYNLTVLNDLSLPDNQLTGSFPSTIGATLPDLGRLQLSDNQLSGFLPPSISNCSKLGFIEMSENKFNGKLTVDFAKLKDMYQITLVGNLLGSGEADEMKFVDYLENCTKLQILDLGYCKFRGVLPSSIGNLSNQLYYLSFGENQLYGNLPPSIGNLVGLTNLYLGGNQFSGNIPLTMGKLQNLGVVSLSKNQFSGLIPDAIGNISSLLELSLNSNNLEGRIPPSLGNCHKLSKLFLGDNKLSDRIPKELLQLSSLSIILNLSRNNLSGSLPTEVGDLKMLTYLDLSHNNLSGDIPSSIGSCTSLLFLSLKGNLFQGTIPPSLSSVRGVARLDLSYNHLSGQIPRFLERFSLEYLDLSFNDFEGEVPVAGVFANANAFSILGNSRLCGGLVELGLPECKETKKHKRKVYLFVVCLLIAFILFVIVWFVYAWFIKKTNDQESRLSTKDPFSNVSYSQLLEATNGFSETNLIGDGGFSSVYKGILDNYGGLVAIKVIHLQIRGADRSFLAECEVWRSIRHRNLLKIITSCSSVDFKGNDFKALVYEFMPNGSLHDWLHSSAEKSKLDIITRTHILIDVACALDYLHNHCLTTIVHGDLKPSNILLDDDMVAHVGDFGLARFTGVDTNKNNSLAVKGTIGYAAPEYGLGSEMTSSGDVYSFGILLLEVITGKRPTNDIFNDGLNLHKFVYMALPDHVTDVIDGDLLNYHKDDATAMQSKEPNTKDIEECLTSILKIGVLCSMDSPQQRMNIKNVVNELQRAMDTLKNV